MEKIPLVIIVGPTASGKTSLSIKIAQAHQGEVISADSRQVYQGMDLGTGKVTTDEMQGVPHHLLDVVPPNTVYNASDFVTAASKAITEIHSRGHLPVIAGGTFFYIDSLLGRITLPQVPPNESLREELLLLDVNTLFARLEARDPVRAKTIDRENPHRLIRAIEIATTLGAVPTLATTDSPYRPVTFGITIDKETLHANIYTRLITRLEAGMVAEVERLLAQDITHERLESFGLEYRYISRYLRSLISYETMVEEINTKTRQFAKRQYTWLKRDPSIIWVDPEDMATISSHIDTLLNTPIPSL
jgi:tRNA dimethylallyltransferase